MHQALKVRIFFAGFVLFGLVSAKPNWGAEMENVKFYEVEAGRITYTLSGFQTGTETVVWKDHGRRSMRKVESQIDFMGVKQENRQTTITDGLWIYTLDPGGDTATKMENPILKGLVEKGDGEMLKTGEDMMRAMGGKIIGKETVLGKPCDLWLNEQMMNMTACVWKGLPLMTKGGPPNMEVVQTATALKIEKIADEEVALPAGVRVVDRDNPMDALNKMKRGRPTKKEGMKHFKGMPGASGEAPDPAQMMEEMKKMQEMMQEEMKRRGMTSP